MQLLDAGQDDKAAQMARLTSEFLHLQARAQERRSMGEVSIGEAQRDAQLSNVSSASMPAELLAHGSSYLGVQTEVLDLMTERMEANRHRRPWTPPDNAKRGDKDHRAGYKRLHHTPRTLGSTTEPRCDSAISRCESLGSTMELKGIPEQVEKTLLRSSYLSDRELGGWASVSCIPLYGC